MMRRLHLGLFLSYVRILASGAFQHAAYARIHLGSRIWTPIALWHYLLVGETRGARPCPFFDPSYAKAALHLSDGESAFAAFLRGGAVAPAAVEFDAAWYASQNCPPVVPSLSPWHHYRRYGLPALKDPAPDVSISFFLKAYHKQPAKLSRALMGVFARQTPSAHRRLPLSRDELARNQAEFRRAITFEINSARAEAGHADLVFVQTNGRHRAKLHAPDRPYDLMLNYYAEPAGPIPEADYVIFQNGTKVTAIDQLLKRAPDLLLRYERILFLDDDVEMSTDAIRNLFSVMAAEGLHLAQPALTADSSSHHRVLYAGGGGEPCRRVNAVEIMAPALSREALHACGAAFGAGISGYGVDILLGKSVSETFGPAVAVIDSALACHSQPVDLKDGSFYRFMVEWGIDPHIEMWILWDEYGLSREITEL